MARKKTDRKAYSTSKSSGISNIYNNERTDFYLGLLALAFAIFLIVAMFSYLSTGADDQSLLDNMRPGEWMNTNKEFHNCCTSIGAILSYTLMARGFGFPAFCIPFFIIVASLKLMRAYDINLWKWFFGTALAMVWSSITIAKLLTSLMSGYFFNPGGDHGLFIVQQAENVIGAPGLVIILIVTALCFLSFVTSETVTMIRKALNPIGYIRNKVKFTIAEKGEESVDKDIPDTNLYGSETKDDNKEEEPVEKPEIIDLNQVEKEEAEVAEAATTPQPEDVTAVAPQPEEAPSFLQQQREARINASNEASEHIGMPVQIAAEDEKAEGKTVNDNVDLNTPINPREPFTRYQFPTIDLLKKYEEDDVPYIDEEEQIENKNRIIEVLGNFGVQIKTIRATVGPTITLYEIQPADGIRISKIKNLEDDIALSLAAIGIRIIAPIPGKGTIGIEVPNAKARIVSMESIINSKKFQETKMELPIAIGKTITNEVFMADLAKIPHLLVAGATGQGKSVGLNAIITSLLYKKHPNELKFVLIDPKKVEFSIYAKIAPHFMAVVDEDEEPIITDVTKVVRTLNSLCKLMDHRYDMLKLAGARNIKEYNQKFVNHKLDLTKGHEFMPYIVVIIDEFGDLIMTAGKEIELPIARIAQLARAIGIHLVIATQRPTTNIITGTIKANFPGRVAFKVSAAIDSKTILDRTGAQQLIGRGDMLYLNGNEPVRVQCAFVDTPEVERINDYIASQPGPVQPLILPEPAEAEGGNDGSGGSVDKRTLDPYFEEAAHSIVLTQQGSTSMIQRRFSIGYNRAGRLMDQLECAGIVGPAQGSKPRDVLIQDENQLNTLINNLHNG